VRGSLLQSLGALLGALAVIAVSHRIARAEGINLFSEFEFLQVESDAFRKDTGQTTESESTRFKQNYNLNVTKTLYPYLVVRGGGIFQLEDSDATADGIAADRDERTLQPFVELNLNNPLYSAGAGYRRAEIEESGSGIADTTVTRDEYNALLGWRPAGLPRVDLRYTRAHTFDEPATRDSVDDLFTVDTRYEFKGLRLDYSFTFNEIEDEVALLTSSREVHEAKVDYSRPFARNRLLLATGYRINYSTTEFSGAGGALIPVLRSAGLSSLDDTPEDGPSLASNLSLIDGNLAASSGIDIGLGGDETTQTNIGLDFGFPARVDTAHVWVDRRVDPGVANSFAWTVYTSPDNEDASTWTLHAVVFPATFGTFQNRFEIVFPPVEARFLKVVTRPLSPAVAGASSFPNILVTEMEAFLRVTSQETLAFKNTDQSYYLGLRGKITGRTSAGYDLSLRHREAEPPGDRRTSISNSVVLTHLFSDVFTGTARLLRTDTSMRGTDRETSVSYTYSASLKAAYIDTFSQVLTYSGTHVSDEEGTGTTNSIFLRNHAQLYTNWSAFLDLGYTVTEPPQAGRTTGAFGRIGTNLVPNRKVTINADYKVTNTRISGFDGESSKLEQQGDFQAFLTPFPTVSLVGDLRVIREDGSSRTFQNYSANWSPFPEGTLQFFFTYGETLRSEDDRRDTFMGPSLRWKMTTYATLDLSYNVSESDTRIENVKSDIFRSNLKIVF
jgi:hypothetical protein